MLQKKGRSHMLIKKGSNFSIKSLRNQNRKASLNHTVSAFTYEHTEQKTFLDLFSKQERADDDFFVESREKQGIGAKVSTLLKKLNMQNQWHMFVDSSCAKTQTHIFHNKMLAGVIQTKKYIPRKQRSSAEAGLVGKRQALNENQKGRKKREKEEKHSQQEDGVELERYLTAVPIFKAVRCQTHNIKTRPHREFQLPR